MKSHLNNAPLKLVRALSLSSVVFASLIASASRAVADQPTPAAVAAFNAYAAQVEASLAQPHQSAQTAAQLRASETIIERLSPPASPALAGAMLHHWRGSAFIPGATPDAFLHLMRDFPAYPRYFSPQVLQARILNQHGDHIQATMRVRQQHILTVVLDTTYDIAFNRLDAQHGSSIAHSTAISEIAQPGTSAEHALDAEHNHGFLWRQNTYWTYQQRDGGLYVQVESISLTRAIPHGLAWAIGPYVESVPRESLAFTLTSVCNALRK